MLNLKIFKLVLPNFIMCHWWRASCHPLFSQNRNHERKWNIPKKRFTENKVEGKEGRSLMQQGSTHQWGMWLAELLLGLAHIGLGSSCRPSSYLWFIGRFLYVPWPGIKLTNLAYSRDNSLTNCYLARVVMLLFLEVWQWIEQESFVHSLWVRIQWKLRENTKKKEREDKYYDRTRLK